MDQAQQMAILLHAFNQLFAANPQPVVTNAGTFVRQVFPKSGLRNVDFDIALGNGKKLSLRLVEQNQNKEVIPGQLTYYAALARQGHKIAWLLDRNAPKGQNAYLGSMQDGQWVKSNPKGVQPTQPAAKSTAVAAQPVSQEPTDRLYIDDLPDMVGEDIPEFILTNYPDPEEVMDDYVEFMSRVDQ